MGFSFCFVGFFKAIPLYLFAWKECGLVVVCGMGSRTFVPGSHCGVEVCWIDKRGVNGGRTNQINLRMFIVELKKFGGRNLCWVGSWLAWGQ